MEFVRSTAATRMGHPAGRVVVVVFGLSAIALVALDQFWLWPMVVKSDPVEVYAMFPSPALTSVLGSAAIWLACALAVTTYEALRHTAGTRWARDYRFSRWRVLKSALLAYGWIIVVSIIPNTTMGLALFKVVDLSAVSRDQGLYWFLGISGTCAVLLGLTMAVIDAVRKARG